MNRKAAITRAVPKGGRVAVEALLEDGTSLGLEISVQAGEPLDQFRLRVLAALKQAASEIDTVGRRAAHYAAACHGLSVTLARPEPCSATINGSLLEGWIGVGTRSLLLTLEQNGVEREALVTPNQNGRFSVALGMERAVRLCPVSPDALLGQEQVL